MESAELTLGLTIDLPVGSMARLQELTIELTSEYSVVTFLCSRWLDHKSYNRVAFCRLTRMVDSLVVKFFVVDNWVDSEIVGGIEKRNNFDRRGNPPRRP